MIYMIFFFHLIKSLLLLDQFNLIFIKKVNNFLYRAKSFQSNYSKGVNCILSSNKY